VRKLIVSEFVSLDGVVQDPGWTLRFESADRDPFESPALASTVAPFLDAPVAGSG
jgi:hypothetical protein